MRESGKCISIIGEIVLCGHGKMGGMGHFEVDEHVVRFPRLKKLSIIDCLQLSGRLPKHLHSLSKLAIRGCARLMGSVSSLPMLYNLKIDGGTELMNIERDLPKDASIANDEIQKLKMAYDLGIAFYITICCILFIISKTILMILLYKRWKRKNTTYEHDFSGGKMVMFRSPLLQSLSSDVLLENTLKLSNKDIIGAGGYGTVYKLMINETMVFAVKRLNRGTTDRDKGFERELEAMADIKHRNIVTLHGYYTHPHYNLLIYELMPNGSLDSFLHGKSMDDKVLDWPTRSKIALGAARGIAYLHHDCIPHIIHRDIKSSNILLDQNMEARVSDFGLATLMEPDKTHVSTFVAGTFGYLAPEYFDTGRATAKGDVYSFGVVLLELLTGKKPMDEAFLEEGTKLVTWVKVVVEERKQEYVVDSNLGCCYPVDEIKTTFDIALMCLQTDPSKRPTMAEVVKMLEQINVRENCN
ncbi:hypothetical protein Godav_018767 [Gossypium davidsonii]|uniref:Protein kinase domain-containing protein n=1 Tax=Gossypium davidsonii TaxID=34287 RepID=A0A7J8QYR7_GOSDV|nr:hypothetical protein [Gossypium davidsonii]